MVSAEQVRLVDDEHDAAPAFMFFGGQQSLRLCDQFGFEAARYGAECPHDGRVEPAGSNRRIGQVHDVMRRLIQLAGGSA